MFQEIQNNTIRYIRVFNFKAFRILKLSPAERIVFCAILSWCISTEDHKCYRSLNFLLADSNYVCCNRSSLGRVITRLKELNLIYSENKQTQTLVLCVNEQLIDELERVPEDQIEEYAKKYRQPLPVTG